MTTLTEQQLRVVMRALDDAADYREDDEACDLHECDPASESPCVGDVWDVCPVARRAQYLELRDGLAAE